eukprot:TRINITY_DN2237_c0_g1_i2.p1 TRINITY_DN2237_c0_g1~~TRINITY_DN2237_c0_g1_i2.p1  ORF type:complete len:1590 (-),score=328.08 TRINITY_DN2237_c0_g1_i2:288-4868(-)
MVNELNANAQDAAAQALFVFFDKTASIVSAPQVAAGIVDKYLGALKPRTVQKGQEILLMLIEIGAVDVVMGELVRGFAKTPKIKLACLQCCTEAIRSFGTSIPLKELFKKELSPLCDDRDGKVRQEALRVVVESYRFIGEGIKKLPFYGELREAQHKELEKQFEEIKAQGPTAPTRGMRSDKKKVASGGAAAPAVAVPMCVDLGDLVEAVPVLNKLPKDFFVVVDGDGKWMERKKMLDVLGSLADAPKLQDGDYMEVVKLLKKLLNDTQIPLVSAAIKIIGALANGLRQNFAIYTRFYLSTLLDKFKEKKTVVLEPLHNTLLVLYQCNCLPLAGAHTEDIISALQNKVPAVKQHTLDWLCKCVEATKSPASVQKASEALGESVGKLVDDANAAVRDAAARLLSRIASQLGQEVAHVVPKLDKKVTEKIAKTTESVRAPSPAPKTARGEPHDDEPVAKRPQSARAPKPAAGGPGAAPASARGLGAKPGAKPRKQEKVTEEIDLSSGLSPAEVEQRAAEFVPEEIRAALASKTLQDRLDAMAKLIEIISALPTEVLSANAEVVVRLVKQNPGWKESNMQVLNRVFQLVAVVAKNATEFPKRCVVLALEGIAEKIADAKQKQVCRDCLMAFCEAVSPRFVIGQLLLAIADAKNPKTTQESFEWIGVAVEDFGARGIEPRPIIDFVKQSFEKNNPVIKAAGTKLLTVLYAHVGAVVRDQLDDVKPQLLAAIEAEFAKVTPAAAVPAKRTVRGEAVAAQDTAATADVPEPQGPSRVDIGHHFTPALLGQLGDTNWKARQDALSAIEAVLNRYRNITPNVGGLIGALKARLADSNKNLTMQATRLLGLVAQGIGAPVKAHLKVFVPGLLALLGDNKVPVRQTAIQAIASTASAAGLDAMLPFLPKPLSTEGAGRQDLCEWFASALQQSPPLVPGALAGLIKPVIAVLQDRTAETRKHGEAVLAVLLQNIGADAVIKETRDLKPAVGSTIRGIIEKHRPKPAQPCRTTPRGGHSSDEPGAVPEESCAAPVPMDVDDAAGSEAVPAEARHPASPAVIPAATPAAPAPATEPPETARRREVPVLDVADILEKLQTNSCVDALKATTEHFSQAERAAEVSTEDLNSLLGGVMACMHLTFSVQPLNVRQSKFVLSTLQVLFNTKPVAQRITYDLIYHTIGALLERLTDDRLKPSDDSSGNSGMLVRAFNMLVLKILENSTRGHVLRALLSRLHDHVTANRVRRNEESCKHIDLACKCLLKLAQFIPQDLDSVDFVELLNDLHVFFTKNPPTSFHDADDVPLRSVKMFLAEVIKAKGPSIRSCLRTDSSSFLARYIESCLQKAGVPPLTLPTTPSHPSTPAPAHAHASDAADAQVPAAEPGRVPSPAVICPVRPEPGDHHQQLDQIFQDIRNKDITQEGIQSLHRFMLANPAISVEPWLQKCSAPFQSYINRQLRKLQNPVESTPARISTESLSLDALRASLQRQRLQHTPAAAGTASGDLGPRLTQSRLSSNFQALEALRSSFEQPQAREIVETNRH